MNRLIVTVVLFVPPLLLYVKWRRRNVDKKIDFVTLLSIFGLGYVLLGGLALALIYGGLAIFATSSESYWRSYVTVMIFLAIIESVILNLLFYAAIGLTWKIGGHFDDPVEMRAYEYARALGAAVGESYAASIFVMLIVYYDVWFPGLTVLPAMLFHMESIYYISLSSTMLVRSNF